MKKCPECGNPSYDGAPVCGNCGYNFPKSKISVIKREDIFQQEPKVKETSNDESTINIIKENKLIIGVILLITLIVICGIILTSSNNDSSPLQTTNLVEYNDGVFSFKYPGTWNEINLTDSERQGAIFLETENNIIIEYYNVTSDSTSLKEITQNRISYAQNNNDFVELVETINIDQMNASNIILENADGNYTRFVSILNDGELHVFKITGDSYNSITTNDINDMINSARIV